MAQTGASGIRFTLDTNILVYSVDDKDRRRHNLAAQIVDRAIDVDCWLTLQAASEFYWAVSRKRVMPTDRAATLVRHWLSLFPTIPASVDSIRAAMPYAAAGRASYWDALLISTAAEAGCTLILTEDLQDSSLVGAVEIHNPFTPRGGLTRRVQRLLKL